MAEPFVWIVESGAGAAESICLAENERVNVRGGMIPFPVSA